eukprot:6584673-Pyramimonas_sp.AAC.1
MHRPFVTYASPERRRMLASSGARTIAAPTARDRRRGAMAGRGAAGPGGSSCSPSSRRSPHKGAGGAGSSTGPRAGSGQIGARTHS